MGVPAFTSQTQPTALEATTALPRHWVATWPHGHEGAAWPCGNSHAWGDTPCSGLAAEPPL